MLSRLTSNSLANNSLVYLATLFATGSVAIGLFATGQLAIAVPKTPEWYQVEQSVLAELTSGGLKQALSHKKGASPTEVLMRDFDLHVRAGDEQAAATDINSLGKTDLPEPTLSQMADFLIGREQWSLTKKFLETFPQAKPGWGYVFIKHWLSESPTQQAEVDKWISARASNKENLNYWLCEQMRFHNECGTDEDFLLRLKQICSATALDTSKAFVFIEAAGISRNKPDFSWLFDTFKSNSAYDQFKLGSQLESIAPETAIKCLNRSLATPFTQTDQKLIDDYMRKNTSLFYQEQKNWEKPLRIWSKGKLAECYKRTKQMSKAQELLVELSKENTAGLPIYAMTQLAGAVQQQLPNRPLEGMIKKAEPENKNSVEYWLGRARYYQGRRENASVIEAYKKALALTQLGAKPDASIQANRLRALNDYIQYLRATNRATQGNALWWQEYDSSSDFNYHKSIINSIWSCDASLLKADNPRLWSYLAQSQNWGYLEEHLLRSMIQSPSFDAKIFWPKAEKLLTPQYPTRAKTLGWVMTRSSQSKRAIPLLESACLTLKDKDALRSCRFTLFEAYLDTSNWRQAEKIWTEARRQLTPGEVPTWLSKIALAAAKQGDKKDALRLWQAKDQIDPSDLAPLQELASYGLKQELIDYYRKMDKESPSSQIPQRALKILR